YGSANQTRVTEGARNTVLANNDSVDLQRYPALAAHIDDSPDTVDRGNATSFPAKHCGKNPGIIGKPDRRDLLVLNVVPFCNKGRAAGDPRHHVIQETHVITVNKDLAHIDPLYHAMQFLKGLNVRLGRIEGVYWTTKGEVIV